MKLIESSFSIGQSLTFLTSIEVRKVNEMNKIEALLSDESFIRYCQGDNAARIFWDSKQEEDLLLKEEVEKAKRIYELIKAELTDTDAATANFRKLITAQEPENSMPTIVTKPIGSNKWWKWGIAAMVAGALLYFFVQNEDRANEPYPVSIHASTPEEIQPGKNTAILTLDDGTVIVLDSMQNGVLAQDGSAKIVKEDDGKITYHEIAGNKPVLYNTMRTPKGGQYMLTLPDNSKVWLNAASSIRYPTSFSDTARAVEVTGEVYMEVAHVPNAPFSVKVNDMKVQVLGTFFNIKAYSDEPATYTTLIQGAVNVVGQKFNRQIKPGQQAIVSTTGDATVKTGVDTEEVLAWKNGLLNFDNTELAAIMRDIGRWYSLDVQYDGKMPLKTFSGKITRNTTLNNVLKILEYSGIHFKIANKTIIVTP